MLYSDINSITYHGKPLFSKSSSDPLFLAYESSRELDTVPRGVSKKYLLETDDRILFFKSCKPEEILGELVSAEIGRNIGLDIVDPIAVDANFFLPYGMFYEYSGVVMTSYRKHEGDKSHRVISARNMIRNFGVNQDSDPRTKYSVYNYAIAASKMNRSGVLGNENIMLEKNFILDHMKLIMFDYLTLQSDRHDHNVEYILEGVEGEVQTLKMSPIFDNSLCFLLFSSETIAQAIRNSKNDEDEKKKLEGLLSMSTCYFFDKDHITTPNSALDTASDFAKIIKCHREMANYFELIKNIDIDDILNRISYRNNIKISSDQRITIREIFNFRRNLICMALEREEQNRGEEATNEDTISID